MPKNINVLKIKKTDGSVETTHRVFVDMDHVKDEGLLKYLQGIYPGAVLEILEGPRSPDAIADTGIGIANIMMGGGAFSYWQLLTSSASSTDYDWPGGVIDGAVGGENLTGSIPALSELLGVMGGGYGEGSG